MATISRIPMVTTDDLAQFHEQHFSGSFHGNLPEYNLEAQGQHSEQDEDGDEDDGLGYYSDGVKRTLTDEQIAIFRHSEIQRLLLKQQRQAEAEADERESDATSNNSESNCGKQSAATRTSLDEGESAKDDDETDYRKFLEEERKQFARDAKEKRTETRKKQQRQDSYDRKVSTRRRVRELDDEIVQSDVVLDY